MRWGRVVVGVLGGVAAGFAMLVGAVSLTRIAGDYLGFPPGLEWTFTGAVDVAGIAGGIMWTAFTGAVRQIGRPMNVVCTLVSGVGVGLDHATHSGHALRDPNGNPALPGSSDVWPWIAFVAGVFVPLLATWILHALSIIADAAGRQQSPIGDRQEASVVLGPTAPDRQPTHVLVSPALPTAATDQQRQPTDSAADSTQQAGPTAPATTAEPTPRKTNSAVGRRGQSPTAAGRPGRVLHRVPDLRPAAWMSDALLLRVVIAMREAHAEDKTYGAPRVMADHRLDDGQPVTRHKADALLAHIRDHRLLEAAS